MRGSLSIPWTSIDSSKCVLERRWKHFSFRRTVTPPRSASRQTGRGQLHSLSPSVSDHNSIGVCLDVSAANYRTCWPTVIGIARSLLQMGARVLRTYLAPVEILKGGWIMTKSGNLWAVGYDDMERANQVREDKKSSAWDGTSTTSCLMM
jgi:hypothetical protein